MSSNPEVLDFRKRDAFNQIDFLVDHGFEAVLLSKNLDEYLPMVQLTVTHVENILNTIIGPYITYIDVLGKDTSEKRLNTILIKLSNLTRNLPEKLNKINESAEKK